MNSCQGKVNIILFISFAIGGATWGTGAFPSAPQLSQQISSTEVRVEEPRTFHVVTECVTISLEEGVFHYKSKGSGTTCGLFLLADPNKFIRITIEYLNVNCQQEGLISVVDGWELNGELFPSVSDHEKDVASRFNEFCGREEKTNRRSFVSSQNAALIQYRIPGFGQGFSVRVQHLINPRPCNILVEDVEAIYTLENYGREVNCSLTTLFHAKLRLLFLNTGVEVRGHTGMLHKKTKTHIGKREGSGVVIGEENFGDLEIGQSETGTQCGKRGLSDYVEIGGSAGLDTSQMNIVQEFCGHDLHPGGYIRIFCGVTTIRLVSSGRFNNKVVAEVRKTDLEELDLANYICDF